MWTHIQRREDAAKKKRNATSSKDVEKLDDKVDWEKPPNVEQATRSK